MYKIILYFLNAYFSLNQENYPYIYIYIEENDDEGGGKNIGDNPCKEFMIGEGLSFINYILSAIQRNVILD